MRRTLWTTITLVLLLAGMLAAQNTADEEYLKAMQISDACQKVQALKAYVTRYAGQGTQYENYANAYICLLPCATTPPGDAIQAAEKALSLGGLDDSTQIQLLSKLPTLYTTTNQTDKAKSSAQRLIDAAKANKSKYPDQALQWDQLVGVGHYLIGKAAEKAGDYAGAAGSYITSYSILKDPQISADLKKLGKSLYDAKKYEDAEKIYRRFYESAKDSESAVILGQTLNYMGRTDEALALFKEAYAKKKSGDLAYNIAIIISNKAKSNPSMNGEATNWWLDASHLHPSKSKECMQYAQSLYFNSNKDVKYNELVAKIQEHNKAIEQYAQTFSERFEGKDESELSGAEKRTLAKLTEAIETEKAAIARLQAEQQAYLDKFNALVDESRARVSR